MSRGEPIPEKLLREALERSGYLLETRVRSTLEQCGYQVASGHSYEDPYTGKSRELDLLANSSFREVPFPVISNRLVIECVNNPQPIVIFAAPQDQFVARNVRLAGLPTMLHSPGSFGGFAHLFDALGLLQGHHYSTVPGGFQYCSFVQKKGQDSVWMATHDDAHAAVVDAVIHGMEHDIDQMYCNWEREECLGVQYVEVYFPILVCQGELRIIRSATPPLDVEKTEHAVLHRNLIKNGVPSQYSIDVVTESGLRSYLEIIDKNSARFANALDNAKAEVEATCSRLLRNVEMPLKSRSRLLLDWHARNG